MRFKSNRGTIKHEQKSKLKINDVLNTSKFDLVGYKNFLKRVKKLNQFIYWKKIFLFLKTTTTSMLWMIEATVWKVRNKFIRRVLWKMFSDHRNLRITLKSKNPFYKMQICEVSYIANILELVCIVQYEEFYIKLQNLQKIEYTKNIMN